jgi:hypothetical protein
VSCPPPRTRVAAPCCPMSCCFYTAPCPLRPPSARVCRLVADAGTHDGGVQLQVRMVQAMTYTQYLFHTFTSSELSPGATVNQEIAQRYHFDVEKLVFSFCPPTKEEQQVPWNICGASANGAPTCPPPPPPPQYTTVRLKSMSIKAYDLDLGVFGVIRRGCRMA